MEATAGTISAQTSPPILNEEILLRLLTQSPVIENQLTGMMIHTFAKKTDLQAILDRMDDREKRADARHEEFVRQFAEHSKRMDHFAEVQAGHSKRMDHFAEVQVGHSKRMDHFAEVQVEHSKRMDHFAEVQAEHSKRMDHFAEVQAEHSKHIDALREDFNRGFNLLSERMDRGFKRVDAHLGALGARWGTESESAFREGMADILAHETGLRVVNYLEMDPDGVVFDRPDQVEIDVVVQDGTHTLVEIKSSVSRADVAAFARKVKFYEREEGVESTRAIIISPMFAPRAREIAQELGMATFPSVYDVQL